MTNLDITSAYVGTTQVLSIYMGDELVWPSTPPTPTPYDEQYFTFEVVSAGTIGWKAGTAATPATIYYSINGGEWTSITSSTAVTSFNVNVGDKVRFKGNNSTYCGGVSASAYMNSFQGTTASVNVFGNIMSLTDGDNFVSAKTFSSPYVFRSFLSFANLLDAENLILPATALTEGCYMGMLAGTSITTAPALPATTLAKNCYWNMFLNTTSLVNAPDILPATTLAEACYNAMFYGTRLTKAPELPATTLAKSCYYNMFQNCYTLEEAPELPATTLAASCYTSMFKSCSGLTYIKCLATDISASNCTTSWVDGVASAGTFVKSAEMYGWTTGVNGIPTGWIVDSKYDEQYFTFNVLSGGTIKIVGGLQPTLKFKKNNGSWINFTSATTIDVSAGDKVKVKGLNETVSQSGPNNTTFSASTATFNVEGNIMSLLYDDNFYGQTTITGDFAFYGLFKNSTNVISAKNLILPATTLSVGCYEEMFIRCSNLTDAPVLPAKTLVTECYQSMFAYCTKLNYIKCLATGPLLGVGYCHNWLIGVSSTGTFVKSSSANWPTDSTSGIPNGWTMESIGDDYLTFEIISAGTIGLFAINGDSPKTIQYSLNGGEWTSMIADGQVLSLTAGDRIKMKGNNPCYSNGSSDNTYNTFNGSTASFNVRGNIMSLIYGDNFLSSTTIASAYTFPNIFRNTNVIDASSLVLPAAVLTDFCYVSMFRRCTSLQKAPSILPAGTLTTRCYSYMFSGCTSLVKAPILPAKTLVNNSYRQMFDGCTSLNYIKCLATDISDSSSTYQWVTGVSSTGTFVKAASMSGWRSGTGGIPNNWTVQDAS